MGDGAMVSAEWKAEWLPDGRVLVTRGDQRLVAHVAAASGTTWVWIDGTLVEFEPPRRTARTSGGSDDASALSPQMSAKVIRVAVAPGQTVAAGDTLIVLEAMKMEMPIRAPRAGVVTAVHCAVGDLVQPGTVLVDL